MRNYLTLRRLDLSEFTIEELRQHIKDCAINAENVNKKSARDLRRRKEACIVELNKKALKFVQTIS